LAKSIKKKKGEIAKRTKREGEKRGYKYSKSESGNKLLHFQKNKRDQGNY